ncbi:MAG: aminotransferase class V-fold PLP-dependent enzyme, partial [Eubacteriales bacterium]|nr:aminotransferase class V-fold PLP-dependent enzyme [Eubacteriales bacterium]
MPGHKGRIKNDLLSSAARFDVTELAMTDDLNEPCGVIAFLETELAGIYSAKHSIMLVNGSTTGNIAMLASIGQSKRILLARDCHKSALAGAALAGHEVISLFPDTELSVITPESVEAALSESSFDAVFITSPTYYGQCCDVDAIADIVHAHGCKLFVDSAHGAHFPFSEQLPCSPDKSDAWGVSCHKTLPSFTQTAILNIGASSDIDPKEMQKYVSLIQSSSPSYIL